MKFICDRKRHLVCLPYSVENLHEMARQLEINPLWYHLGKNKGHYDIPKGRIEEITSKCIVVNSKTILKIIKGEITEL